MYRLKYILTLMLVAIGVMSAVAAKPKVKTKAPDPAVLAEQAEEALVMYDIEALSAIIDKWDGILKKGQERPARLEQLDRRLLAMTNMLQRVEQIVIVDSISVDTASFLSAYRLSSEAGKIGLDADAGFNLPARVDGTALTWFTPAEGREMFFSDVDSAGYVTIMHAGILDDGSRESATNAGLTIAPGSNTAYPFMMADGMTVYFASDADTDSSLGGYDIYRTRRNEEGGFYEATNLGMPYNSPANDYMLAIDETTSLGWWATDRNAEDGKVNIYVFVPNTTRVNYDPDRDDISDLAFITEYRNSQPDGFDAQRTLSVLDNLEDETPVKNTEGFELSLGNGKVYTDLSDFKSADARRMMQNLIKEQRIIEAYRTTLAQLRAKYAAGDRSVSARITDMEQDLVAKERIFVQHRNDIIRRELRR